MVRPPRRGRTIAGVQLTAGPVSRPGARPEPTDEATRGDDVIERAITRLRHRGRRRRRLDALLAGATPVLLMAAWQLAAEENWIDPAIRRRHRKLPSLRQVITGAIWTASG